MGGAEEVQKEGQWRDEEQEIEGGRRKYGRGREGRRKVGDNVGRKNERRRRTGSMVQEVRKVDL